jgi:hypothetical protein
MYNDKLKAKLEKLVLKKEALVLQQVELIKRLKEGNTKNIVSIIESNPKFNLVAPLLKKEGII